MYFFCTRSFLRSGSTVFYSDNPACHFHVAVRGKTMKPLLRGGSVPSYMRGKTMKLIVLGAWSSHITFLTSNPFFLLISIFQQSIWKWCPVRVRRYLFREIIWRKTEDIKLKLLVLLVLMLVKCCHLGFWWCGDASVFWGLGLYSCPKWFVLCAPAVLSASTPIQLALACRCQCLLIVLVFVFVVFVVCCTLALPNYRSILPLSS